ncbi:MAG: efflux RND transporter periplasmic adaptor subunit [Rhodobacteraceae bacterium]|nr:MAG: efflux RND transporter periplasmic adaptor subunit [Paracoccaceae bacterium]
MSIWKQLLILCLLAALGFGGYEAYQRNMVTAEAAPGRPGGNRPALVEVAAAELRVLRQNVEAVGTTRARQSVDIVPESAGQIVALNIVPGQAVEQGTVLAQLDDTIARADLTEAEARLTERERVVERFSRLVQSNAVSTSSLDEAVAQLAEARSDLDRARRQLEDRSVRAPFGGVVGLALVDRGARVEAGTVLTSLDDLSEVEVEFSLPETLFARISRGQTVRATGVAFPGQAFDGRVEEVDSRIDPVSRSFRARAVIPNPDGVLPAGMFMSLDITLSETEFVVVPEEAIVFQAAETYVYVVADGTARRVPVRTGQRRDGVVAVVEGLAQGDVVIIRGLHRVRDGGPVEILSAAMPSPAQGLPRARS